MRFIVLMLAFAMSIGSAFAGDKKTFNLTANQILELGTALSQLDTFETVVGDKVAKQTYTFEAGTRLTLARNYSIIKLFLTDLQDTASKIKGDDATKKTELDKLGSSRHEIDLFMLSGKDIGSQPVPITVLGALNPILE
jgi:hypothetical protein